MALNNVPLSGQSLDDTRVPINQNFATINTAFNIDHVDYNVANQGKHKKVSFPVQSPVPAAQAGIVQLYSQTSAITGQPELVFAHQSGSTAPLAAQIVEFTSAGWANPGWTRLPSGILLKWRSGVSMASVATVSQNMNADIPGSPAFTTLFSVFLTTTSVTAYDTVVNIQSITGFDVVFAANATPNPPGGFTIAYLAIGI